jgi:hypothetical protein
MADWSGIAEEPVDSAMHAGDDPVGFERAGAILGELVEATRSAAEALLDEQRRHAATQVKSLAEAVHCAAECLERLETWGIGRYAKQGAGQIEQLSQFIAERNWSEIVAETQDFARHRPWLFLCVATVAGFVAGRVLAAPAPRQPQAATPAASQLAPDDSESGRIPTAVSGGDSGFVGQHPGTSTGLERP